MNDQRSTRAARARRRRDRRRRHLTSCACCILFAASVFVGISYPAPTGALTSMIPQKAHVSPQTSQEIDALSNVLYSARPEKPVDNESATCPITYDEIVMLSKVLQAESQVVYWNGIQWGVSHQARQAAVAWCALNRLDDASGAFPDTLAEVLAYPNAFAYSPGTEPTDEMLLLAQDVVDRWWAERCGESDVGRTLPEDYFYFHGDGRENHFRREFADTGDYWGWTLPDPYEVAQ